MHIKGNVGSCLGLRLALLRAVVHGSRRWP